jgi:hypothetical protein
MIQSLLRYTGEKVQKHAHVFWERSTLFLGLGVCLLFPHLAVYAAAPYATMRVFRKPELSSIGIFILIGLIFDGLSSANFLGFFTLLLPVTTAFTYSLKHFFQLNLKSAGIFCFLFSCIISLSDLLTAHFFLEVPALSAMQYSVFLVLYPLLFSLVCVRLLKLEKTLLASS